MAVYVDESRFKLRGQLYCHMIADSEAELDAMADTIGLKRAWKQAAVHRFVEHYDLAPSKRALAICHGAIELSVRELPLRSIRIKGERDG